MNPPTVPTVSWRDRLFAWAQLPLPTLLLSTLVHHLTRVRAVWFKNALIRGFVRLYGIDLTQAEFDRPEQYENFNHFFTRALKPEARPWPQDARICLSPVDGTVSQIGPVTEGRIVQAKGIDYSVAELLGSSEAAQSFVGGSFATIYLAPYNYHRIHMPADGVLREWSYVPGRLFSVNAATARALPRVFARNERLCARFQTPHGPMAMVLVGALFVGGLETVWSGPVTPPHGQPANRYTPSGRVALTRGGEMGRFNMGSTVILLFGRDAVQWYPALKPETPVRMGQTLGIFGAARGT